MNSANIIAIDKGTAYTKSSELMSFKSTIREYRNDELKAANTSYLIISGSDKMNYKELKEELKPYELEDVLNLKRYNSLNLIKYEGGYAKFITQLPKPII